MHMEIRTIFGLFVWRGVNIDDVTIHHSRGSRIKPTLKVCEHNRVAHTSLHRVHLWWKVKAFYSFYWGHDLVLLFT